MIAQVQTLASEQAEHDDLDDDVGLQEQGQRATSGRRWIQTLGILPLA
jgi:hypothetical protein